MFSDLSIIGGILCCWLFLALHVPAEAQRISLNNPSLEGRTGKGLIPAHWLVADGTPDTQPGVFEILLAPSAGNSYIGMHSGKGFLEGIAQQLPVPLRQDSAYILSMDLAYTLYYLYPACYGNMAIFGGNAPGDTAELLWMSGNFTHENWRRYHAVLRPHHNYAYISCWAYPTSPCNKSMYGIALLMDNLSAIDPLIPPVIQASVKPCSCGDVADGRIMLHVSGGAPPYRYRLDNGQWQTDSVFPGLAAGMHMAEIADAHDYSAGDNIKVESPWKNCMVVMPGAFSPNGDGQNDLFRPKVYDAIHDYRLRVYDRWGGLVFSAEAPEAGWDGNYKGMPAGVQAYVYICTYTDSRGGQHMLKGTVTLIR
ncbi:T9SS type B sorting domain-containing protein [Chitinophaga polysaccharea]|uniref:T9SS type B sorting domain-containing protein n=1 Tax=Chitinophaga polysaccharea TaxID=1293035 RepID=UPI0011584AC4|nr:gliding motility-associated C-terminal domain-containing protein [Chitinophaga polysaccharea]